MFSKNRDHSALHMNLPIQILPLHSAHAKIHLWTLFNQWRFPGIGGAITVHGPWIIFLKWVVWQSWVKEAGGILGNAYHPFGGSWRALLLAWTGGLKWHPREREREKEGLALLHGNLCRNKHSAFNTRQFCLEEKRYSRSLMRSEAHVWGCFASKWWWDWLYRKQQQD